MSEAPLMNNEAARSPTGEIIDQTATTTATPGTDSTTKPTTTPDPTSTKPLTDASTTTESPDGKTTLTKPEDKSTATAPEKYTDFKAPEGYTIDPKTIEAATPIFRELGLSQEAAQKLVDFHTNQMITAAKAPTEAIQTQARDWQAKTLADPEIKSYATDGKIGIDAVKVDIGRALNVLSPELRQEFSDAMNWTGVGNNPAFVKALWKLSQFVTEGKHVAGSGPSRAGQRPPGTSERPRPANALYPNLA